jgi:hypothetical protein
MEVVDMAKKGKIEINLKLKNSNEVKVLKFPKCEFCNLEAHYDGTTILGPWGYMCEAHFRLYGRGLGVGIGQKLTLIDKKEEK